MNHTYLHPHPFVVENGDEIARLEIAYSTFGQFVPGKSKVVWVCHALTANSDVYEWWPGLFGPQALFNDRDYFIICANILGSCYGTTGPLSVRSESGGPFYHDFPEVTVRDMVGAHRLLARHLLIDRVSLLIGGSLGGQQALEWSISSPGMIQHLCLIATNARHSPWGIAFNESQRMAIAADQTWPSLHKDAGNAGLKTARSIALLTYRNYRTYQAKQLDETNEGVDDFKASSYQQYQGHKLALRFNAFSYWVLTKAMDSHNIGRGRPSIPEALAGITSSVLVVGFSSDILFPVQEQEYLARHIRSSRLVVLDSLYGHDGFLIETATLSEVIMSYLAEHE